MKIEITEAEYRDLLDILYIAEWVLAAHKDEEDPRGGRNVLMIQKLYALANGMGFGRLIEYDPGAQQFYPTREFEDTTQAWEAIDEFVDRSFWDELIFRLAERDAERLAGGYEQLHAMSRKQRIELEQSLEGKYSEEFIANGLDNVVIFGRSGNGGLTTVKTHD